ncbi:MAG: xanthine dehydrogenase family protein molybdopterin-binding subunit [Candidatus Cloacimonetes bacterium]|jgi:CO/xanthine dehydrogenase Mo-binding subunit|nr:xanthine dehydrogenase family protein molybdopterin-binding subunit [Candidatus Cloacimonadota bacterium]MCB5286621.1 xanthine dehydrogenase family protein molybdopterin-binding subunit [Candidatus Cloacimonadota bacterium]MCK9185118.1 xanthine dehydrogenase family protein molybdopterin-binding subunit [Candidatus Cloacimonadota bacterium]MCK9583562.1 xanthine dehydrogenase family protein molybdopterin-binding subunit [Candidatus Cloacimonadota bacterium]MDY0228941.1 xanthine dehydrogenase f
MKPAFRNDALAKVSGTAKYTDDYTMPQMLHAVPLHAQTASARIESIDCSLALQSPGVVRIILAEDIPGQIKFGQIIKDYPTLVHKRICSTGDVLALIVAESRAQALAALPLVKVQLEKLPPIFDPEQAMNPNAELINPEYGSNLCNYHRVRTGDILKGEEDADLIIEQHFSTSRIEHAYLEPEAALAHLRPDGVIQVIGSMQHPFSTRRFVASTLGFELGDVEVRTVPIGGAFGGKDDTAALVCARAALCAYLLRRPVKLTYSREMSLRESYKRHPYQMQYRMGVKRDGLITFVKVRMVADGGAYCSVTPWVTWRSTVQCCGCYAVPNVHCDVYGVYTNNVFSGAFRGFGSPQVNFAVEQLVEIAAQKLGLDEIDFRRQNMVKQGSTTVTNQVLDTHKVSLKEVMDRVLQEIDYEKKREKCSFGDPTQKKWYGIGLAISYRGMSLGAEGVDFNSAIINVQPDGSVLLETGVHENGQGSESAMILIASQELGLPVQRIRYRMPSTSNIPDGGTTVASRGTLLGGGATVNAARILKSILAETLLKEYELAAERFADGQILTKDGQIICTWEAAIALCYSKQVYPYAFGVFQAPRVSWDEETGHGDAYFTWVYGCQAVELEVDPKTLKVTLLNMVAAHDVGKAINPAMVKGQFYGGLAMGAGYGLFEEVPLEDGGVIPTNLHQYRLMRATDLPEMTAIIVENPDPTSPSKAKGIGEPTLEITAPAIANAIYRATGKRYVDQPLKLRP